MRSSGITDIADLISLAGCVLAAAEIACDTSELLRRFAAQLSAGDAAVLLGVSKGRIRQLRILDGQGILVADISLRRPTLDEVFLALTQEASS